MAKRGRWDDAIADDMLAGRADMVMEWDASGYAGAEERYNAADDSLDKGIYFLVDDSCVLRLCLKSYKRA